MKSVNEYVEGFSKKLLLRSVLTFMVTSAVAGALLYIESQQLPLPESYGRAIAAISHYKQQILKDGVYIYLLYSGCVLAGVMGISLMYSYRVARPFRKMKEIARAIAEGNPDTGIEYAEHDVMHPLAAALGRMAKDCDSRREFLDREISCLANEARTLLGVRDTGDRDEFDRIYVSLVVNAAKIEMAFEEMKL